MVAQNKQTLGRKWIDISLLFRSIHFFYEGKLEIKLHTPLLESLGRDQIYIMLESRDGSM